MIAVLVDSDPRYHMSHPLLKSAVEECLKKHRVSGKVEVGVSIVGDRKMQELNLRFRKRDKTADVLSFPLEDPTSPGADQKHHGFVRPPDHVLRLGDVVVSYPQAMAAAAEDNMVVEDEIVFLVQHGVEHLLGIHHEEELQ